MSSSSSFSLDSLSSYEQLCYVHCSFCDTVLAVSVPCSNLFNTVTVRCGHCTNLLSVNMRSLLNHLPLCNSFFPTTLNILEGINPQQPTFGYQQNYSNYSSLTITGEIEEPKITTTSRPTEKRQRVPSAYNRFIKEEIQRIKAMNPEISHREAFSAAAKNWAHFPHIHFGLVPDQNIRRSSMLQQEWETVLKDGPLASSNASVGPF